MPKYKLLALDLDDTLLNNDKKISEENKYWISQAREAGVIIIFATGRGTQRVEHLQKQLNLYGPMVLVNGAEVWEKSGKLLTRTFLQKDDVRLLYNKAGAEGARTWGYSVDSYTKFAEVDENDIFDIDWLKFGIKHPDRQVIEELRDELTPIDSIAVTSSGTNNLEISAKGISKKVGVRQVCTKLGLKQTDVMAVGDSFNDLQLLKDAGLGVAMSNAAEKIKQIADKVTETNENNGVAAAIKKYLLETN